jgi:MFS family permease
VTAYLRILRTPRFAWLLAASIVGRLPIGINGLAMILFLREETGSFALPGAVAGGLVLGTGLAAPVNGRLVDRLGSRVLVPIATGHAIGILSLLGLGLAGAPGAALIAMAIVTGTLFPPSPSLLRASYPVLLRRTPELVPAAYALDSTLLQLTFVTAPLLVALIVLLLAPPAALVLSAALAIIGTTAFVAFLPDEIKHGEPSPEGHGWLGALRAPGIQTLVMTMLPLGFAFGAIEVALPAFGDEQGHPELGAVLIAVWSFAAAVGGFTLGVRKRRASLADVHRRLTLAVPFTFAPLLLASSTELMLLLLIPAGLFTAPVIATRNELAQAAAPVGSKTEALTWPLTALVGGVALGAATGGQLIDASGWRAAIAAAVAGAAIAALISVLRRASLRAVVGV